MIRLKENSQKTDRKGSEIMKENRYELNKQLAQMLKGGVIMDVTTPEQAKIAEEAGACAVMALERIPADIRAAGGVSRMSDPKMIKEIQREIAKFEKEFEDLRIRTLLSGEYDSCNAIVTLHAGAGGTESCDWAAMLYRMYTRWASDKGFSVEVLDSLDGEEAGIKSITFQINGENAYGYMKSEKGVHRLVRISPFNAQGKRQTSFVSLDVMPDIEGDLDVDIDEKDLRIDTYRSSGAGGQHINKTSSAIRITHIPTGTVVQCQNERSQFQNKDKAMQMLKAKLYLLKQEENAKKAADIRGDVTEIGWGNQIRSYVLQPYTLVKDHRTDVETGNVDAVLDGGLDIFINGYLKWLSVQGDKKTENS